MHLPVFPRTPHLPGATATGPDDLVAGVEALLLLQPEEGRIITYEEKLDGANVRIHFNGEDEPVVGNREKVLNKGYVRKDTPAKMQFRPLWTWVYDHRDNFRALTKALGHTPTVFGEWLYARHTIRYNRLPALFVPFDIRAYVGDRRTPGFGLPDPHEDAFLPSDETRQVLTDCGFAVPPLLTGL